MAIEICIWGRTMMKKNLVLITDPSEDFCCELSQKLTQFSQVLACKNVGETLEFLAQEQPDVLVLDLMMPDMDGISLIELLNSSGRTPKILATSSYVSPYIQDAMARLNVICLMEKPCCVSTVAARVRTMLQQKGASLCTDSGVSRLLLRMGFSAKLRGYAYLREAVLRMASDPDISLTNELYPGVAGVFGVTSQHVEHSIRGAVMDAWKNRPAGVWELYLAPDELGCLERPTNAEIISALASSLTGSPEERYVAALERLG